MQKAAAELKITASRTRGFCVGYACMLWLVSLRISIVLLCISSQRSDPCFTPVYLSGALTSNLVGVAFSMDVDFQPSCMSEVRADLYTNAPCDDKEIGK